MSSSAISGPIFTDNKRAPSGTAAAPSFAFNDSTGTGVYLVSAGVLGLSTAGVQRVVVDASGNVGIGTDSPASRLHTVTANVTDGFRLSNTAGNNGDVSLVRADVGNRSVRFGAFGASGGNGAFVVQTSTDGGVTFPERMRLDASGNLLVGYTSGGSVGSAVVKANGYNAKSGLGAGLGSNVFNIQWTGNAQLWIDTTNVGNISLVSDYRIKKNIETQEQPALARITKLRPVKYELTDYKELFKADGIQREGFIAHELQEVIPSAVEGEKDAEEQIQSLKLDALCSVMVKAIQEQQAQIEALKAEVAALKAP